MSQPESSEARNDGDGSNVANLASAAERHLRVQVLFEVGADESGGVRAFGFYDAGIDAVDADLLGAELARRALP